MPTVAIVEGVRIQFYPIEHPPPHFHVRFAEWRAQIDIDSLNVLKGELPRAKLAAVVEWARPRRRQLHSAWIAIEMGRKPEKIA